MMRWIADILYLLAGLLYAPVILYHALRSGKNRRGWGQRFGAVPRFEPSRPRVWIHAVSLGEINATPRLVEKLQEARPDVEIVFSTTTDTGFARAVQLYGPERVFRFPLDFSLVVTRALNRVQPTLIVLVELEVWYNLIGLAHRRGIPVVVVNGRLTRRSAARFGWIRPLVRPMFARLRWVGAQEQAVADRFIALGVPPERVEVTSSMKWDTAHVADAVEGADELARDLGLDRKRPLWVCGSTGPGEEDILLEAYRALRANHPTLQLALVPRKPERFDDVARLIERHGFVCARRSRRQAVPAAMAPSRGPSAFTEADERGQAEKVAPDSDRPTVWLGDTMGELRKFYSLADVVFVGRSLVPMGGSDPMEVAALERAMAVGPHMDNFQTPFHVLRDAEGLKVVSSAQELTEWVADLLRRPELLRDMGRSARDVVLSHRGATARTVDRLGALLGENAGGRVG